MAILEQYAARAIAQSPQLLDPFIDKDLSDAHARRAELQSEMADCEAKISELMELKYQLHPEQRPQTVVEAQPETPAEEVSEDEQAQ